MEQIQESMEMVRVHKNKVNQLNDELQEKFEASKAALTESKIKEKKNHLQQKYL